jgi:hypothetical protein
MLTGRGPPIGRSPLCAVVSPVPPRAAAYVPPLPELRRPRVGSHVAIASRHETLVHDRRVLLEQFHLADFARKVVEVGSVGTRAWTR